MKTSKWNIDYSNSKSIKRCMERIRDRYDPHPLKSIEISNGVILPYRKDSSMTYGLGGALDAEGRFVKESAFFLVINRTGKPDWGGLYEYSEEQTEYIDETVIYGGFLNNNEWGHFLTDWSVRLWYAVREDKESKVVFCRRGRDALHPNIRKVLFYAGIPEDRMILLSEQDHPKRFRNIVIPEASMSPHGYTDGFRWLFEDVAEKVDGLDLRLPRYEKIYLTRTGLIPNKDFGEKEIEDFYKENGFQVLQPEQLSIEEQIYYLRNCNEIASLEGSAPHNILFAKKGLKQTVLEKTQAVNERQMIIHQCCDSDVTYVGTYPRFKFYDYYSDGPFLVGITNDFLRYCKSREFTEKAKKSIIIWICNYCRYFTVRPARRVRSVFGKALRTLKKVTGRITR